MKCENDSVGKMNGNFCHKNSLFEGYRNRFAHSQNLRAERFFPIQVDVPAPFALRHELANINTPDDYVWIETLRREKAEEG